MSASIAYNDRAFCRCCIRIPSSRDHCLAFDKDKYLEPMFGDVKNECLVDRNYYKKLALFISLPAQFVLRVCLSKVSFVQLIQAVLQYYSFLKLSLVIRLHSHQL